MTKNRIHLLGAMMILTAACADDAGTAGLAMSALSRDGKAPVPTDTVGTSFTLQQGLLHLRHIEIDLPQGQRCADLGDTLAGATCRDPSVAGEEAKIRIAGPIVVDLVAGTSTPTLANVVIPAGSYKRIDLRVGTADSAAMSPQKILFLLIAFVTVVAGSILITQGQRRIPIQQAKQMRGRRVYGG
jgi:hypothetical protein